MPDSPLRELRRKLIRSGVSARYVNRSVTEIDEHLEDLKTDAIAGGMSELTATRHAYTQIGDLNQIAAEIIGRPELKSWLYRYPRAARVVLPIAYVAMLPAIPLFAGVAQAQLIARWGTCLMLSAVVTAAMFFAMQLSITLA